MIELIYESWAWIEIYSVTEAGRRLDTKYGSGRASIHTDVCAIRSSITWFSRPNELRAQYHVGHAVRCGYLRTRPTKA